MGVGWKINGDKYGEVDEVASQQACFYPAAPGDDSYPDDTDHGNRHVGSYKQPGIDEKKIY
jgi:hypothetical protein